MSISLVLWQSLMMMLSIKLIRCLRISLKKCAIALRKGHTLNNSKEIIQYLEELAKVLIDLQVTSPFHILIAGGAYMILQDKRRSTMDIDFAIVESPGVTKANKVFRVTVQRAEISSNKITVPFA